MTRAPVCACPARAPSLRRPMRSNSFDLGNWAAAGAIAEQIAADVGARNRRGSFKKDPSAGLLPQAVVDDILGDAGAHAGITPPHARRKVSFSGQLPTAHATDTSKSPSPSSLRPSSTTTSPAPIRPHS